VGQRSLKVIEISAIRKLVCDFLFVFYSNYGRIRSRLWDIQCKEWRDLENQVRGRSKSLKMGPFDRPYATLYWSVIVNLVPFSSYLTLNNIVTLKPGLEVTQDHWKWYHLKAWVRFLFAFMVTMAVSLAISEIFSIKKWPDLEMWVWGCSRSLKMVRFDRPCMTFY